MNPGVPPHPTFRGALRASLPAAALLWLTVCVFVPAGIFYANYMEYPLAFASVLPGMLLVSAAATAVTAVVVAALPGRAREVGLGLLVGLGVLAWIQSTVLRWSYGVLDGRPIDWAAHRIHGLVDAGVWIAVLAVALVAARRVAGRAATIALALIVIQGGAVALLALQTPERWIDRMTVDDGARFALSKEKNAILLVVDTFQSDVFQEILDTDPSVAARFRGFTYFRNATAGFSGTTPSVALLLTGTPYRNEGPYQQFVRQAFTTQSLPKTLKGAGFHVYYNHPGFWFSLYADPTIASHVTAGTPIWGALHGWLGARHLMRLGVFRSVPQAVKRHLQVTQAIFVPGIDRLDLFRRTGRTLASTEAARRTPDLVKWRLGDAPFFREFAVLASATMAAPAFKYFHVWGLHPPLTHDESFRPLSAPYTRANVIRQARGLVRLIGTFLDTLDGLGVYDDTLLVIVGDHGAPQLRPRLVAADPRSRGPSPATSVPTSMSVGLPLVLVKRLGASGPLSVSDAPVTLEDVAPTIAAALGHSSTMPGTSMYDVPVGAHRKRRLLRYDSGVHRLADGFLPPMTEYEVDGFSWLEESWTSTGRQLLPGETRARQAAPMYTWGAPLRFAAGGNAAPFLGDGWAAAEEHFTWTNARSAHLRLGVAPVTHDLVLTMDVVPALVNGLERQRAEVFANGRAIGEWSVQARGSFSVAIPGDVLTGPELDLTLLLPDASVPRGADGRPIDERELGLAVISAVVR
jgi:hypothetical protein